MKLLLLGDSIRLGYAPHVRALLPPGDAVFGPEENGRFTLYTLRYLHEWARQLPAAPDVVHWNNGLWDATRYTADRLPLVPADDYVRNLRRILLELRSLFPDAKIIFALTTSVTDRHPSILGGTLDEMNAAARALMDAEGVPVNDLHALVAANPAYISGDAIHMTDEGYRALAGAVVRAVTA